MNPQDLMHQLELVLADSNTGVLATVDQDGKPAMRWMTPVIIKGRNGVLFTVTSPHFLKVLQVSSHPDVEWMIQTRALDQIINLKGKINVLDNPSIKSEIIEFIGSKLTMFWKTNQQLTDFIILETVIEEAEYYLPMKAVKKTIHF